MYNFRLESYLIPPSRLGSDMIFGNITYVINFQNMYIKNPATVLQNSVIS